MSKLIKCKTCGAEIAKSARNCPGCGAKNKKPIYKKWWFWLIIVIICVAVAGGGADEEADKKIGEVTATETQMPNPTQGTNAGETTQPSATSTPIPVKTMYQVGDILLDGDMKIVYMSSGIYQEENEFLQPSNGMQYIYIQLAFENLSASQDNMP